MKNAFCSAIAGAGLLVLSFSAVQGASQNADEYAWHQTRDQYFSGNNWQARMFDRIRTDLDHVQVLTFCADTRQQVSELQIKMNAGTYDRPELDEVIGSFEELVGDNRPTARDRDMLADDLTRIRNYRSSNETWH